MARRSVSPEPLKVGGRRTGSPVRAPEPSHGANRREGLLLAGYVLLFLIGVWTVVVSELSPQQPAAPTNLNVMPPTQQTKADGK